MATACLRCEQARLGPDAPLVYTFAFDAGPTVHWDVRRARALPMRSGQLFVMDLEDIRCWVDEYATIDRDHLAHIPEEAVNEPGLIVDYNGQSILIDGSHRAAIKADRGESFRVYVLNPQEQRACQSPGVSGN